jgi:Tol biopolymer transport system component/DNA-binding winged helix-turn-helix (wHTH) protein
MQTFLKGQGKVVRFDVFEVDLSTGQLTKRNRRVKVQDLPFRLLVALLERPGGIVTREQLRERLWGETVVDFDDGLHTAIRKLRDALGDSAAHPRFIETVPRRGYRFVATVSTAKIDEEEPAEVPPGATESTINGKPEVSWARRIMPPYVWMVGAGVLALGLLVVLYSKSSGSPGPVADLIPITSYRGLQRSPTLSPAGTQVAFTWDGGTGGNLDLYVQNIDGSGRVKLTFDQAPDLYPAWSPDGRAIAFVRNEDLLLIPAIGGPEHKITSAAGSGLSWSPDSQTIGFSDREAPGGPLAIFLISVNSKERRRLTAPAASKETDSWAAFSPDGREIAFVRGTTTTTDVNWVSVSGGVPTRVAIVGRPLHGLIWSPDGQYLLLATGRQPPGLLAVPASARDVAHLDRIDIAGSDVYEPCLITRGPEREVDLAYAHEFSNWDIWGTSVGSNRPSPTPLAASSRADQAPSFSPDGLRLAFNSARSGFEEIWVSMADGSQPRQLTHFNSGLASSPRWSPDGEWIAFDATINNNRDIYVIRADGGSPVRMTRENSSEAQPSWSRSGQWIYFMSDRSGSQQIWKMPAGGGQPWQITKKGGYQALESPDGQTVYYAKERQAPGIWSVPVNGGPELIVSDLARQNLWSLANDGIYYFDLSGQVQQIFDTPRQVPVRKIDLTTRKVTTVANILTDLPSGVPALDVRGDGKYLAWVGRREHRSELMLIRNLHLGSR